MYYVHKRFYKKKKYLFFSAGLFVSWPLSQDTHPKEEWQYWRKLFRINGKNLENSYQRKSATSMCFWTERPITLATG